MLVKYRGIQAKYYELAKEAKYWGVGAKYCASIGVQSTGLLGQWGGMGATWQCSRVATLTGTHLNIDLYNYCNVLGPEMWLSTGPRWVCF